jgi:hypothetical protein
MELYLSCPPCAHMACKGTALPFSFKKTNNKSVKCNKLCNIRFSLQYVKIKGNDISRHFKECILDIGLFHVKSFHSCDDFVSLIHPLCCIQKEHNFSDMGSLSILKWKDGDACTQVQNKELCLVTIEGLLCFCCGYQMTDEI